MYRKLVARFISLKSSQTIKGQKCFRKIVQQAVAQLEQVRVVSKSATTELFRRSGKYSNVTTVQLQGILMNWKATEKDFFLVASTKWGKD